MKFKKRIAYIIILLTSIGFSGFTQSIALHSLHPNEIFEKIDLNLPGLEPVKESVEQGNHSEAFNALLHFYRDKFPKKTLSPQSGTFTNADNIVNHIFQWGPYESADYGEEINWEWDPRGDIEWVAAIYRFYWAKTLASAYEASQDEKYAKAFVELTADWIQKHPLENYKQIHPVYTHWRGFPWLDIQTGIRATNLCQVIPAFIHAESFTPEFLGVLMASLYDHQVKTKLLPMNKVHNKAIFEQRGFINIAHTFPEFKESREWLELALDRVEENLLAQTTSDGVQREWSGGYHLGVLRDAVEIMQRMKAAGINVSSEYLDRVRKMYDYIFAIASPDLGFPMFGDASRPLVNMDEQRSRWPLYKTLKEASQILDAKKYEARAELDINNLPDQTSYAFSEAGIYAMRNEWGPNQIYMTLHCAPPAISSHDQQDNGTFELYAFGRWLMPDTGFYTYGHDREARNWHRQTCVHQTLTLNNDNTKVDGKELLWRTSSDYDLLVVENPSYKDLIHRRSVWFVDKTFFVILDDAIGQADGDLDLHFQFAPGAVEINAEEKWAATRFQDANVLVWADMNAPVSLEKEEGWFAWKYGSRKPRQAIRFHHNNQAPATFLTLVVPYQGVTAPHVSAAFSHEHTPGSDEVQIRVKYNNQIWDMGYGLAKKKGWCEKI